MLFLLNISNIVGIKKILDIVGIEYLKNLKYLAAPRAPPLPLHQHLSPDGWLTPLLTWNKFNGPKVHKYSKIHKWISF